MHEETLDARLRLRISSSTLARAEKWAERNGKSLSAYARTALQAKMDEDLLNEIQAKTSDPNGD